MINSKVYAFLCALFILVAIIGPNIPNPVFAHLRPESLVLLILAIYAAIYIFTNGGRLPKAGWNIIVILLLFAGMVVFSGSINFLLYQNINWSFLIRELMRFLYYIVVFLVFLLLKPEKAAFPFKIFFLVTFVVLIIQYLQFLQPCATNAWLKEWYGAEVFFYAAAEAEWEAGGGRAGSVYVNPNVLGAFLVLPFAFLMSSFLNFGKQTNLFNSNRLQKVLFVLIIGGILLTQSRVVFTGMLVVTLSIFGLDIINRKKLSKKWLKAVFSTLAILLIVLSFAVLFLNLTRFFDFARAITDPQGSMVIKFEIFRYILAVIFESGPLALILGKSPGALFIHADTEFGYLIYWYGLTGLVLYGVLIWRLIRLFKRNLQNHMCMAAIAIVISTLFFGIASTVFINIRIYPLILALLAMVLSGEIQKQQRVQEISN